MPKAMVSLAVAQIAPGTVKHGVWLVWNHVPRSEYPGRPAIPGCAALISSPPKSKSHFSSCVPPNASQPHAHRTSNAANPYPDAPTR
jgi:hypothetical protein